MRINDLLFVFTIFTFTLILSEWMQGAPSSIYGYYCCTYNETTEGLIIHSGFDSHAYDIHYSYTVNGKRYSSNKVNFSSNDADVALKTIKKYPKGETVTVFYDKNNPNFSVLEKGSPDGWLWFRMIGTIYLGFGLALGLNYPDLSDKKSTGSRSMESE